VLKLGLSLQLHHHEPLQTLHIFGIEPTPQRLQNRFPLLVRETGKGERSNHVEYSGDEVFSEGAGEDQLETVRGKAGGFQELDGSEAISAYLFEGDVGLVCVRIMLNFTKGQALAVD